MLVQYAQASGNNDLRATYPGDLCGDLNISAYPGSPWTRIYRIKYACWREYMAQCAQTIVKNDYGRYSDDTNPQSARWRGLLWQKLVAAGYRPDLISGGFYCDCSALTYACMVLAARKFHVTGSTWDGYALYNTHEQPGDNGITDIVNETGVFDDGGSGLGYIPYSDAAVTRGVILWRNGHCAIAINGAKPTDPTTSPLYGQTTKRGGLNGNETIKIFDHAYILGDADDRSFTPTPKIYYRHDPYIREGGAWKCSAPCIHV